MIRRDFIKGVSLLTGAGYFNHQKEWPIDPTKDRDDERAYWVQRLTQIGSPVLEALSNHKLKSLMPVEAAPGVNDRKDCTYLEAFARTLAGMAPWLELGADSSAEGKQREKFISLSLASIRNAVTPSSPDFMNFSKGSQPLVDAAFLAHALIRAPKQLWENLDAQTQEHVLNALRSTRVIKPYYSNWLLFTAMVEAALLKFGKAYDAVRVDYAIREHLNWYKGDGVYGDGPEFHFDYYNSYVIHPMLIDVTKTVAEETDKKSEQVDLFIKRAMRYAEIQERMISPEGTFPPVGRSMAYRCGAFHLLAQLAFQKKLPDTLVPAQVRAALAAVIKRTIDSPGTFDSKGWLTIGLSGHQASIGEGYISTGSLYLCSLAFLPLGLPPTDEFWTSPAVDWTSKKAFTGAIFPIDHAL